MIDVTVMVYLFGYLLVVYVCVWKVQEGLVLTEYIVAVNIFVVTYLIRVVACGDCVNVSHAW